MGDFSTSLSVNANYSDIIRLRNEIALLQKQIGQFAPGTSSAALQSYQMRLRDTQKQLESLTRASQDAGKMIGTSLTGGINQAAGAMTNLLRTLQSPIGGIAGVAGLGAVGSFLEKMTSVRAEFESLDAAIKVLVGERKTEKLMNQLKDFAKVSPLDLKGSVAGAKMMLGFGIEAEKIDGYLRAIGDVSMGDAQRFQSLTLAFSQMSAAGKLMGQDLNQMINAGFNPLQTMAEKTGKSISQLKDEMSKGKVSAKMVQDAFIAATSEGGKYYGMSEVGAQTLSGKMGKLQDAMDFMFNDLGKSAQPALGWLIDFAEKTVSHWKEVGSAIAAVAFAIGAHRAIMVGLQRDHQKTTNVAIEGYGQQMLALQELERKQRGLNGEQVKKTLDAPDAVRKIQAGESLTESDTEQLELYNKKLEIQRKLMEESQELQKAQGISAPKAPKYDNDLQSLLGDGMVDEDTVAQLQEQRNIIAENKALADATVKTVKYNSKVRQ